MKKLTLRTVEKMATESGFKMTPQRRAIVDFLAKAKNHPTADAIFSNVNKTFPMTSRATVYNTLNWLKDVGMLQERYEAEAIHYDPNCERHHHFVCRICEHVEDVGFDLIDDLGICSLPNEQQIEDFEITLKGVCKKCNSKK